MQFVLGSYKIINGCLFFFLQMLTNVNKERTFVMLMPRVPTLWEVMSVSASQVLVAMAELVKVCQHLFR